MRRRLKRTDYDPGARKWADPTVKNKSKDPPSMWWVLLQIALVLLAMVAYTAVSRSYFWR